MYATKVDLLANQASMQTENVIAMMMPQSMVRHHVLSVWMSVVGAVPLYAVQAQLLLR